MKRILSLILVWAVLLLPASALAAERDMATLSVGNFKLEMNGETISLPVTLKLGGGVDEEGGRGMALVQLLAGEETAGTVRAVFENEEIKALIDGMDYGLFIPLEEIVALVEDEMGASIESLMTGGAIPSDIQDAGTRMGEALVYAMTSTALNAEELLAAMGISSDPQGETALTLFGEEIAAEKTVISMENTSMADLIDATSAADEAWAAFWASYYDLFLLIAEQSGDEISIEYLDAVFSMLGMSFRADIYTAENASHTDLTIGMTVDGETVELPIAVSTMETESGTLEAVRASMTVDGETLTFRMNSEIGESAYDHTFVIMMTDEEYAEITTSMTLHVSGSTTEDDTRFSLGLYAADEFGDEAEMGISYLGGPAVCTEEQDEYEGRLNLFFSDGYDKFILGMDTGLTLSNLPEGDLLTLPEGSVNPLTADEATMEQFADDAQPVLMQAVGVLMQNPEISELLGGYMN